MEHSKGRKTATHALNELTIHFHSRRTKPPTYAYTVMCAYLWGGNSRFAGQYVQSLVLHPNSSSLMHCLSRPPFSSSVLFGAETAQIMHTHTPCNAIVKFCFDVHLDHFALYARKRGPKIGVAHLVISRYLLSITAFCAVSSLLLTSVLSTGRYTLKNFRLFSYFSNPVHLLTSENPAHFSHPILAL